MARLTACLLTAVLGAATGCSDPSPPPISWSGEHLDFGQNGSATACNGTLEYLDRQVGAMKQRVSAPNDLRVKYYWLPQDELHEFCVSSNEHLGGCAKTDGSVFADQPASTHELVHGVRSHDDFSYGFLEEGIATAWEAAAIRGPVTDRNDIESVAAGMSEGQELGGEHYALAGHFVGALLDDYGTDPFVSVTAATSYTDSYAKFTSAFSAAYGEDWPDALDAYSSYPDCDVEDFTEDVGTCEAAQAIRCSAEPYDGWVDPAAPTVATIDLACDGDAVGPLAGNTWASVAIEFPEAGNYEIWVAGDQTLRGAYLRDCESGCRPIHEIAVEAPDYDGQGVIMGGIELEAGTRTLQLYHREDEPLDPSTFEIHCWGPR
jgi:hypothetical protein